MRACAVFVATVPSWGEWQRRDSGTVHTTTFPLTENPLSEGGSWTEGLTHGLDWNNVEAASGNAIGTAFVPTGYADNIAHLHGVAANQYIEGIYYNAGGYAPATAHELELLLRFEITANNARGYECLILAGAVQIVRWNGAVGDFTVLTTTGSGIASLVDGDAIRAEITGSAITIYKNGVSALSATDTTYTDGNPGVGMFTRVGDTVLASRGWQSISAGVL